MVKKLNGVAKNQGGEIVKSIEKLIKEKFIVRKGEKESKADRIKDGGEEVFICGYVGDNGRICGKDRKSFKALKGHQEKCKCLLSKKLSFYFGAGLMSPPLINNFVLF